MTFMPIMKLHVSGHPHLVKLDCWHAFVLAL